MPARERRGSLRPSSETSRTGAVVQRQWLPGAARVDAAALRPGPGGGRGEPPAHADPHDADRHPFLRAALADVRVRRFDPARQGQGPDRGARPADLAAGRAPRLRRSPHRHARHLHAGVLEVDGPPGLPDGRPGLFRDPAALRMSLLTSLIPGPLRRRIVLTKAYKEVFGSIDGQIVLKDLVRSAAILEAEPGKFAAGRRSIVLEILQTLRFDETALMALAAERLDETNEAA